MTTRERVLAALADGNALTSHQTARIARCSLGVAAEMLAVLRDEGQAARVPGNVPLWRLAGNAKAVA